MKSYLEHEVIKLFMLTRALKFVIFIIFLGRTADKSFDLVINFKMPTVVGILKLMTRNKFMLV